MSGVGNDALASSIATSQTFELNIALVFSLTDASSLACAVDGSAGTSVCYDGVLAQITADAYYDDTANDWHELSIYWKNDGSSANGPLQTDVTISNAATGYNWDLAPTSSTDTTVFDSNTTATSVAGAGNW